MMLIQKMAKSTEAMRPVLAALMQIDSKQDGAPDVAAYQSQSGGILEMLGGLEKKFKEELADVEAAETSRVQNYDMNMIQLTDLIKHSKGNQEVRKLELEAIAKAIEIISNPNVADSYAD